jgi:SAM-dependent methyltransferase
LEIGPGTGQATISLAKRGYDIVAVELGQNLARIARKNLKRCPHVRILTGAYEDVDLPAKHFELAYCATALHWVRAEHRFIKTHALLQAGAYFAIFKGAQISDGLGDLFFHASQPIYRKYWPREASGQSYEIKKLEDIRPEEYDKELFRHIHFQCFPTVVFHTADRYCRLLNTESDKLALPLQKRDAFLSEIKKLINDEFGGGISKCYANPLTILKAL